MSRTGDAYVDHCNSMEGFDEWWDESRRRIEAEDLQRMYQQQYRGLHA